MKTANVAKRAAAERVRVPEQSASVTGGAIIEDTIARPSAALQQDDPAFRKAYLRLCVDRVIVSGEEIRLTGPTHALAKAASDPTLPRPQPWCPVLLGSRVP